MSENPVPVSSPEGTLNVDPRGVHYDFLKSRIPRWFMQAAPDRQRALADHPLSLPAWYSTAPAVARQALAGGQTRFQERLNEVDVWFGRIEAIAAFAEPRLKAAIKQQFNLDLDVRNVYFARKYGFQKRDDLYGFFVFDVSRDSALDYRYRGVTLLEAALANFTPQEEEPISCDDCQIITHWGDFDGDVIPSFAVLAEYAVPITPHAFAKLCRTLDLGALYQAHIKAVVQPENTSEKTRLEQQLEQFLCEQFGLCLEVAHMQGAISVSAYPMLARILAGQPGTWGANKPVSSAALQVFDSVLVGPLLIGPERLDSGTSERLVVYLPDDPQQPLKEYANSGEFMADLRARLHSTSYRRFFSRYIPAREQGLFFQRFDTLYQPAGEKKPNQDYPLRGHLPRLPMNEVAITGALWERVRQAYVRKQFADAAAVAVPTGVEDQVARMARLDSYLEAVVNVLNLAAFVVPGLGPIMLTVGAAQMMSDVFEGVHAYEEGDLEGMWAHFSSVALNTAFIAAGASVLPHIQLSGAVDHLKRVTLASGEQRLWNPDLTAYESVNGKPQTQPDAHGLYVDNDATTLTIQDRYYRVEADPDSGAYRISHPSRPDAYQPRVRHNGQGAWLHEADLPQTWSGTQLMRRLGPVTDGFTDSELEQIRQVSGVEESQLRRMHTEGEPTPAVLLDTAHRFRAYGDAIKVSQQIHAGTPSDELCGFAAALSVELPGWPVGKAIEVQGDVEGAALRYGVAMPTDDVVRIRRSELIQGQLPARIVDSLTSEQLQQILGQHLPATKPQRALLLAQRLSTHGIKNRARLFQSIYSERLPAGNPAVRLMQRDFKHLPTLMVQELLDSASADELAMVNSRNRIPLRLAEAARKLQARMRLAHAYEGLYLRDLANVDTEALVLNTLEKLPGWHNALRLEVRDASFSGTLRAEFGPTGADSRKVLVRMGDGRYQPFDEQGQELHGINGLYGALQRALPDSHRKVIGLPHVGQGEQLEGLVIDKALNRDQLRQVLRMQPERKPAWRQPRRLTDNRLGYPLSGRGAGRPVTVRERVRMLYPTINDLQLTEFLRGHVASDDAWLRALENEFEQLDNTLNRWLATGPRDVPNLRVRRKIRDVIRSAWQKSCEWDVDTHDNYQGQRIRLENRGVGAQLATLPALPGNFDHVSSLHLPGCGLTDQSNGFLSSFRALRILNLERNNLTRLPDVCAGMPRLEGLDLSDNRIVLTEQTASHIRGMPQLIWLALEGNPLGRSVDISRIPQLKWLYLAGCGLQEWPPGLFGAPRPRDFLLDLSGNHLNAIPNVAPGSERARIIARSVVTRDWLSPAVLETFNLYTESVGMDPSRRFPPRGTQDSAHWMSGMTRQNWMNKQPVWDDLEEAPGSEPFFDEIRKLSEHLSKRSEAYRDDLTAKVWRMLEAMARDSALRERLFEMALAPTTCVDAGAQLFNAMGVEVLLHEALELTDPGLMRLELLDLAKGKARLDELGRIAHARVAELLDNGRHFPEYDSDGGLIQRSDAAGNPVASIDEVEIHLAYVTRLADRLDLPWQSAMFYTEPDVTPAMIEQAYTRVRELESGDLLRDGIIEQPFWANYVQTTFAADFAPVSAKSDALIDLNTAQQEWLDDGSLSAERKVDLRKTIDASAQVLGKSASQVSPGQVMSDDEYYAEMTRLGDERKNILRTLTDRIMGRAS
ncbi:hypothetical protein HX792_16495 [Pseudomonas sp. B6002]|uniref:dermonecrotic toxin domain-containing protein n=1 Tax=Pseudomonas sp. B6002 TaxID=2726978 RepID=UPI0015A47211|nr:DUF6543 domain-containing protein [Pseudomonas sp. B6002]NVZ51947.1 hypothetical protein [Pseudomonas sp. B6002]